MDFNTLFNQLNKVKTHEEAIKIARTLAREFPDRDDSWHTLYWNIGLLLSDAAGHQRLIPNQEELIEEMKYAWQHYMELCPKDYNTCWNMAGFLKEVGRYSEAAEIYLKAAQLEKQHGADEEEWAMSVGFDYYHAADCYHTLANYEEAIKAIDTATSTYETYHFWELKAQILENMGRYKEAKQASKKADKLYEAEDVEEAQHD